jgi:hypothetical protein
MSFILADTDSLGVGRIVEKPVAAAQAWERGALLVANGTDQWTECGADPALIAAVAESAAGADTSGFNILGRKEFPANFCQAAAVQNNRRFRARFIGSVPGNDGGLFGVVKDADNLWKVDFTDVVNTRVKLISRFTLSPESQPEVLVEFLAANIQQV